MTVKYFSEKLNKYFDTEELCNEAEALYEAEQKAKAEKEAAEQAAKQKAREEREARRKEIEDARAEAQNAQKKYAELVAKYAQDYGVYYNHYKDGDSESAISYLFERFFK